MTKPVAEVLSTQVEAWQREVSALQEKIAFAIGKPVAAQEPVFAFRRKGQESFCTCNEDRYNELAQKPNLFEVTKFYANAAPCARCAELDSTFGQVIADAAKELGCDPDNEAILESIFALSTKLKQQTERADFAWKNTQTIDKARAEEMLKRDELQAKITEQAALIEKMDIENTSCRVRIGTLNAQLTTQADHIQALEAEAADRESFLKTLADTCTEAERIAIERAGRIDVLESECRKLRARLEKAEPIVAAARNLIEQKGRHNTEIAYKRLADAIANEST